MTTIITIISDYLLSPYSPMISVIIVIIVIILINTTIALLIGLSHNIITILTNIDRISAA